MQLRQIVFSVPKEGDVPADWEDGAAVGMCRDASGQISARARFAMVDGATETYESRRWVEQLINSFMSQEQDKEADCPALEHGSMNAWFKSMQERWHAEIPSAVDYIDYLKFSRGTLATFIGGELIALDGDAPAWRAAALGDVVLFHVRNDRLVTHFPPLQSNDFNSAPEGICTLPGRLGRMSAQLMFQHGCLAPGDSIFIATDAFAKWIISLVDRGNEEIWPLLGSLAHPSTFTKLVTEGRRVMGLNDDDITLMRMLLVSSPPASTMLVCG